MATTMEPSTATQDLIYTHDYYAEAHVLHGELQRPIQQKIERHAPVELKDRRGGHLTRFAEDISIEGLISFRTAQTRVSGSKSLKHHGWVTLATSIMEGLNVFEVMTADRIVGQVATDHPPKDGRVPHVTFLGTKFTNLQVSGYPLTVTLNLEICGKKPDDDKSYFNEPTFLDGILKQTTDIRDTTGLPEAIKREYGTRATHIGNLIDRINDPGRRGHERKIKCSLVKSISGQLFSDVKPFGHLLAIEHFGTVALGEIEIGEKFYDDSERPNIYVELVTIKMDLGCVGHGAVQGPTAAVNGHNHP